MVFRVKCSNNCSIICLLMVCTNDMVLGGHDKSEDGCYETVDCY